MTKPRKHFVQRKVLEFYKGLPPEMLTLPFDVFEASKTIEDAKGMSYQRLTEILGVSMRDVVLYTESEDGCVIREKDTDRYIILYNEERHRQRTRFTMGHEIGHILLDHFKHIDAYKIPHSNTAQTMDGLLEREADCFASTLLCPLPVLHKLNVGSPEDIKKYCDISTHASTIAYEQYQRWKTHRRKTAWESNVIKLFSSHIDSHT